MPVQIRPATTADHPAIVALNLESEHLLSPMDGPRLARLEREAAYLRVAEEGGEVLGFLLALREGADYDSPNYLWFAQRYLRFLYIDRVVVALHAQGRRVGAAMYDDLFAFARAQAVSPVTCEFYSEPLNEPSQRFHARYGFHEVGSQWVADGAKRVSLQVATP
ncbi:GNAT family N-acetyltransferase [Lysobacter silvisoli]|uniref:GNAT family N-acetyltransferase n=1 Tax=Lysobacter silvisoli TaxID=2293254 RepID=A0A371JXQ2_9GAMM|nr:GNAT family N-acetyltransferase [Lysobacter silvisoli]RDZ26446.1 GNAT family N-acetyltransferase [Lysobacter silvisoli]